MSFVLILLNLNKKYIYVSEGKGTKYFIPFQEKIYGNLYISEIIYIFAIPIRMMFGDMS
jgi:hypothetical protein